MISASEILATLDESCQCLRFENVESSNVQRISSSLVDKINVTIIHNERILDGKFGNYGFGEKDIPLTQIRKLFCLKFLKF